MAEGGDSRSILMGGCRGMKVTRVVKLLREIQGWNKKSSALSSLYAPDAFGNCSPAVFISH